ncbi:MAG: hypothetical protein AB7I42_05205 [Bradyrhizobium sp.]|uniref:hypothetical protein n=1 Tax=Bradyrhizobium sp. TaxID=376 RepID=UPI003D14E1D2
MAASSDRRKSIGGRLPMILLGVFAAACLVALVFLGDLARYQESAMIAESQAALRDVSDSAELDRAIRRHPANRILKLVALAEAKSAEIDAAVRRMLDDAGPATLAKPVNLAASSRADLEALRGDLMTAERNVAALAPGINDLVKTSRAELQTAARVLRVENSTIARFMAAIDELNAEWTALAGKIAAARGAYYSAYDKCAALLIRESGSYKVTDGQLIFRLQPTADSYNAASAAMAAAVKSTAELEAETNALRRSQLERWKKFVGG